jgi:hypothetical protein
MSNKARQRKNHDLMKRNRKRQHLLNQGLHPDKVEEIIERMRIRQAAERAGAVPATLPDPPPDEDRIDAFYEQERQRFDDAKHRPTHVDSVLRGQARATGATAVAVKRRRTLTAHEYHERERA